MKNERKKGKVKKLLRGGKEKEDEDKGEEDINVKRGKLR
jgi:hypothetical protein